jgi:hypothetical protein
MNTLLDTPVVFIIFNRPEPTRRVFEQIRKVKPVNLFIIADGPRTNKSSDQELCKETRSIVETIDWSCNVQRNYSEANMGCGKRVSSGLDWVFNQCDQAIILEDDCVPTPDFFRFCTEMLEKYKLDSRVLSISGFSAPTKLVNSLDSSYYFSRFFGMWGWATWKRAWNLYDFKLNNWPQAKKDQILIQRIGDDPIARQWERDLDNIYYNNGKRGIVDTWDFQFSFTHFYHDGLVIKPRVNLISNIGVGTHDATHTLLAHKLGDVKTGALSWPLIFPIASVWNKAEDLDIFQKYYAKSELAFKIKRVLKQIPFVKTLVKKILYRI